MPSAEKRQRQKENRAEAQAEQHRSERSRRGVFVLLAVIVVGAVIAVVAVLASGDGDESGDTTIATADATVTTLSLEEGRETVLTERGCVADIPEVSEKGSYEGPEQVIDESNRYRATLDTSCGAIVVELDVQGAPTAANNFVFLAREGFYDGLSWHRIVEDFVIQSGSPTGPGAGGPGYVVEAEPPTQPYEAGSVAFAKSQVQTNGTSGSQFFIVTGENVDDLNVQLNDEYQFAGIGTVVEGLDAARRIEQLIFPLPNETGERFDGAPFTPVFVFSVEIEEIPAAGGAPSDG